MRVLGAGGAASPTSLHQFHGMYGVKAEDGERRQGQQQPTSAAPQFSQPLLPKDDSTSSLRGLLSAPSVDGLAGGATLRGNMSTDSIGMGMGSVGMGQGASTLDLQGLLRSGSHVDLGAELYEDSLNLSMPHSDSVQSLDQMLGINSGGSSANLQALEVLAGRQAHTAHTMDRRWEW